jgi:hypothetical protein
MSDLPSYESGSTKGKDEMELKPENAEHIMNLINALG